MGKRGAEGQSWHRSQDREAEVGQMAEFSLDVLCLGGQAVHMNPLPRGVAGDRTMWRGVLPGAECRGQTQV